MMIKKYSISPKKWIQMTYLLFAIFLIPISGTTQSIDLELSLTSGNANAGVFENVTITATITNNGTGTATGVLLEFPSFTSDLPVTGDPAESQGFFSNWWTGTGTWDVGALAAGASATVDIGLFPLGENLNFYGEVLAATGNDGDSSPSNGTSPNPVEDDEAVITINDTGGGNCELTTLVSGILCSDNGTPNFEFDDMFQFEITVNGQNTSGNWTAELPIPSASSTTLNGTVGPNPSASAIFNISGVEALPNGILTFTVEDANDASCSKIVSVSPPPTCSNGGGPCSIVAMISNIQCSDNGTPNNSTDDMWKFDLLANGTNSSSTYLANIGSQTFLGNYGEDTSFGLFPIAPGDITVFLSDSVDPSCATSVLVDAPAPCSNGNTFCSFVPNVSNIQCFDNSTPNNPNDDTWSFDFSADNANMNSAYIATIDGQPFFGAFNQTTSFGSFPIASGDITLTIANLNGIPCGSPVMIAAPAPCSNGTNGNNIDLALNITGTSPNPIIYDTGTVSVMVENTGTIAATNVEIAVPSPAGYVYQGGNEFTVSQGSFNFNDNQVWTVGSLAVGATATLDINYFFLADPVSIANYAQVVNAGQIDADSTPDNGTCCTPNEDDEAVFNFGGAVTMPDLTISDFMENWPTPLAIGVEYPFTFDLKNIGATTAMGNYRVGVYLSTDGFLDGNDYLIGEVGTGNTSVGTISGVLGLAELAVGVPSDTYFVLLVADDLDDISETNENNNIQVSTNTYIVENDGNVCTGLFVATSQAALNQFNQTCTTWAGAIELSGNITDLSPLDNLDNILGNLTLDGTQVVDLSDLGNLQSLGALFLYNNGALNTVEGLSPTLEVAAIQIINNTPLNNIGNLPFSNTLTDLTIANNPMLSGLTGLQNLVGNYPNLDITLAASPNITSLSDLQNVTQLNSLNLSVINNLSTLAGLENIAALENLNISANSALAECCAIYDLLNNNGVSSVANISANISGCNSVQDVLDNCVVSNCQITATVLDIQCQSNLTLTDGSDDTFVARVLVEGSADCAGNFRIDGQLGGIFGSTAVFGQIANVGPFSIADGDVIIEVTDVDGNNGIFVTLTAPTPCSNGIDANECGFEQTYDNFPTTFIRNDVAETNEGYQVRDLSIDFAGNPLSSGLVSAPTNARIQLEDGNFITSEPVSNSELKFSKVSPDGATTIWENTVEFDYAPGHGDPILRDVIETPDGIGVFVSMFSSSDAGFILKLDNNGAVVFNNYLPTLNDVRPVNFIEFAANGDFLIVREDSGRSYYLMRITTDGTLLYNQVIQGDLVTNTVGGFDETPDANFIYAAYDSQFQSAFLKKLDAFTGEIVWQLLLNNVFSPGEFNNLATGLKIDVAATADGGAVVGYPNDLGFEYGRISAAGNLVWSRILPINYEIQARTRTSDGGFIFTGGIDGEFAVVKTTSEGLLTPACTGNVAGCQITATVLDVQCQSNLTLSDGSDDTYTARILVEGTDDCFGNYKIDGVLGGTFGSPVNSGKIATAGPFPISGGDVTIEITDFADNGAISVTLNAPTTCSNGIDNNECGFENTYPPLPTNYLNLRFQRAVETDDGYDITSMGNTTSPTYTYDDLSIDFAGEEISTNAVPLPAGTFSRASDGDFFTVTNVPLTFQLEISKGTPGGAVAWSNTFNFDTGGLQGAPNIRDVIELPDGGYAFLVSVLGATYKGWILKTDEAGNLIFNKDFQIQPDGFLEYYFDEIAENGDFIIYRQSENRVGQLIRASGIDGSLIFEEPIIGDLVSNRFGGFAETPDGNFIYASYREFPFPILEKLDAFTGERQWKIRLTDEFPLDNDITFFGSQADVVATSDGGAVVGYFRSSPEGVPFAYEYGKVNAAGNLVWSRLLPDTYRLNAKLATSDGGILFVGRVNGEFGVVKTTSEGLLTPTCTGMDGCQITGTVIDVQCQSNLTLTDGSDDTFVARVLVEGSADCAGNFRIDGQLGGIFGSTAVFGQIANVGPFSIADGDVIIEVTDVDGNNGIFVTLTAPTPCSNGIDANECGFEQTYDNFPTTFIRNDVAETNEGYQVRDLSIDFAGNPLSSGLVSAPTNARIQLEDGNFITSEPVSNSELKFSKVSPDGATTIWENTVEFDYAPGHGDPILRDVIETPDGIGVFVSMFSSSDAGFILKLDNNGDVVFNNYLPTLNDIRSTNFIELAANGDFMIVREDSGRGYKLMRITTDGVLLYNQSIQGDLVINTVGGFDETPDANFIYAAYDSQFQSAFLKKLDAFTGEIVWQLLLNNVFSPGEFNNLATGLKIDVAATADGGAVVGYPNDLGFEYGRISAAGNLVWSRILPINYEIQARTRTSDGGFIFTGGIDGEFAVVKTTSEGLLTPTCVDTGGGCELGFQSFLSTCDDNATPNDTSDDFWIITMNPEGTGLGATFSVSSQVPVVNASNLLYGQDHIFGPFEPAFFGQAFQIPFTITDDDFGCSKSFILETFGTCSPGGNCTIDNMGVTTVCDDNGSPNDPSDDIWFVEINPQGTGFGATYDITGDLQAADVPYGATQTFGGGAINNEPSYTFTITDESGDCFRTFTVDAPTPCSNGGSNGVDLELAITSSTAFAQYQNVSFEVNLTNTGIDPVANMTIYIYGPEGGVYAGGNEGGATSGTFFPNNGGTSTWDLSNLGGGETEVLTMNIFVLDPNEVTVWAEVEYQSTVDDDSTPSSYFPTLGVPLEDDEDMLTLSNGLVSMPLVGNQQLNNTLSNQAFLIEKLYPNPTANSFKIELESNLESDAVLQITNVSGVLFLQKNALIEKGKTVIEMNAAELPRGVYFLKIETERGVLVERFLKE